MAIIRNGRKQRSGRPQTRRVPITDPWASAQAAGLRYASDTQPGIRRTRVGKGFRYIGVDGSPIRDPEVLRRIRALVIPPAWSEVWICPRPDGHIQATGRDAKGRKQFRYHPHWRAVRDATKYDRLIAFGEALPLLRARLDQDLGRPGLPREKVLAAVVRLLETTLIRIGNAEYVRQNGSFGLTTLRDRHVQVCGATIQFQFRGKSGILHSVRLNDRRLAAIVKRCQDLPGYELFQYLDAEGQRQTIDSADVNAYLRQATGQDFTAKDVRTWAGTVLTACTLWKSAAFASQTQAHKNIVQAIDAVAKRLGNTRAVCRKCYVHPTVLEAYLDQSLFTMPSPDAAPETTTVQPGLQPEEAAVLAFLKARGVQEAALSKKAG
jgi:DNA topoisomerase-1